MIIHTKWNGSNYVLFGLLTTTLYFLKMLVICLSFFNKRLASQHWDNVSSQQKPNIFKTFKQRRPNVFNVGPTLYKCYTNGLFWQRIFGVKGLLRLLVVFTKNTNLMWFIF